MIQFFALVCTIFIGVASIVAVMSDSFWIRFFSVMTVIALMQLQNIMLLG